MTNFLKGLWADARAKKQPEGTYPFGKNGILYNSTSSAKNELGFNLDPETIPGTFIGAIETDSKAVIFSTDNVISYIGYYDTSTNEYTAIINDSAFAADQKLGFNTANYITGEFQRNYLNQVIVAWTNKVDPPFVLNCDEPNADSAQDLYLFLRSEPPTLTVTVDSGGILERGAYFVAIKYLKLDGASTGYISTSGANIVSTSGSGTLTDKALSITLTDLDTSYDQFQIAIISRINGVFSAVELDPVEISDGSITIIYSGENITYDISLEEVLVPYATYIKVGTMGQLNDSLYIADLETEPELDLQMYVNNVKVRVKSELIEVTPPPDSHVSGQTRSLMHQEVYAIYMRFKKAGSGAWTKAFTIPGNVPLSADLLADAGVHETDLGALTYQVKDTNRNIDTINKTVDTGIWVNQNETYPNTDSFNSTSIGGLDLRGEDVRHHRMPSIAWCKDNFYSSETSYGRTKLDILSLEVSNLTLPAAIADTLTGYEILIAKRTISNSTVLGQSLLMVSAQSITNALSSLDLGFTSTGGNWHSIAFEDSVDPGIPVKLVISGREPHWGSSEPINATARPNLRFRLHSFDMLFNKPAVTPAYMSAQLKMRVNNLPPDYPTGGYIEAGEGVGVGGEAPGYPIICIIDYTKGISPTSASSTIRTRVVEDTRYLPNNVLTGKWDNRDLESAYVGQIKWIGSDGDTANNDLPLSIGNSAPRLDEDQSSSERIQFEETYLVNLMDLKDNVYLSFYSQLLIASGQIKPIDGAAQTVYAGDVFLNDYSFHTYGLLNADNVTNQDNADPTRYNGYKIVRRFVTEAVSNINLRYEIEGNIYSKWWPNTPLAASPAVNDTSSYMFQMVRSIDPNQFGYSRDLNALNELGSLTPYNPFFINQTQFPYRIHRGGKLVRQGKARSWRTFLPLDYYEAQKNMGRIIRILGKDDRLLIHHENALFATQDKTKLETDVLSITLGSGDIFQFEPQEAMSAKQGYAGTQHELAAVDTPFGYVFLDAKQGQVFIFKQGLRLVNNGLNQLFQEYLKQVPETNPLTSNGITVGYDPEFKRILLTVKNKRLTADIDSFVPDYVPTQDFIDTLVVDESIVYRNGKYVTFIGEYVEEGFVCDDCTQPAYTGDPITDTIPENSPNGTFIAQVIGDVVLPDVFDNQYASYFIISGNTGGAFYIDASGNIRIANSGAIDFETTPEFNLVVRLTTNCGAYVDILVTVTVTDVNEPPIANSAEIVIVETLPLTTIVYSIDAEDPEETALTYSLVTTGTPFTLNPTTGVITLTGILDMSTTPLYVLEVLITDEDLLTTTIFITIAIDDTIYYFTGENGTCDGDDLIYTQVSVRADAIDGPVLATFVNDGSGIYNSYPVPVIPPVLSSPTCTDPPSEVSFSVENSTPAGNTVDMVSSAAGVFYILDPGNVFPVNTTETITGIGVTSSAVSVTVTNTVDCIATLYRNGIAMDDLTFVVGTATQSFTAFSFAPTDEMYIELTTA